MISNLKNIVKVIVLSISTQAFSQVGIGTQNPQGFFHIDSGKDNPKSGTPSATQATNDFIFTNDGRVGVGTVAPNANAQLELNSTNKGLLLPRVALSATNNAAPLAAHVTGMVVYNTATASSGNTAVTPGLYINDGTKWAPMVTSVGFVPAVITSASLGVQYNVADASGSNKCRLSVVNINDGNYNNSTFEYSVTSPGTYNLALTQGYRLNNNSGNNSFGLFAIHTNAAGTVIKSIRLAQASNLVYTGTSASGNYLSGNTVIRASVGDKFYFSNVPCNGCAGNYTVETIEATIQKVSN
ncbi:MAG: hypothetical protein ACOVOV_07630 [Dolichospermum sp.]